VSSANLEFVWHPLSIQSQQRLNWDAIYKHVEVHAHGRERAECTPQRLARLKERAQGVIAVVAQEFATEADLLRRERFHILGAAGVLALACVVLGCLVTVTGYDLIKAVVSAGGAGGLMTWGITLAFRRLDHESELRLLPKVFAAKFGLCHDCDAYERTFDQFSRATESLRVKAPDSEKPSDRTPTPN
jgi:hypothetical protein